MSLTAVVGGLLPALDAAFPTDIARVLGTFLHEHADARWVGIYLADYDQLRLRLLPDEHPSARPDSFPVDGSEPGRAFRAQAPTLQQTSEGTLIHLPVSVRAERLGVLSVCLPAVPAGDLLDGLHRASTAVAYVLMTAANYTDIIERGRRDRPLELPAEIQWTQLPVQAYTCPEFAIAGQLVPAYQVGGDLFDYAVDHEDLTITATDAMGHGLNASVLGALAVAALRNARRTGYDLGDQIRTADNVLHGRYGGDQFVTALSMSVCLTTGHAKVVNAGHPAPFLLRGDHVSALEIPAQLPMGMFEATPYEEHELTLETGDRLLIVSDGVLEARSAENGEEYGQQRLEGALLATRTSSPAETVRQMVRLLQTYQDGEPRDDATILCLDWTA